MIINENKKIRLKTKNKFCTSDIDVIVDVANQNPYTATNATEMAQYLASKYYGSVVKYTGTTGTYTQNRLYKVIQATSSEYTFEELITPVGSTTKTENGTYDVKEYAEVVVNVPTYITVASESEFFSLFSLKHIPYAKAAAVASIESATAKKSTSIKFNLYLYFK